LTSLIAPLVQGLRQTDLLRSWFFIRYFDPEVHLRLRLRGASPAAAAEISASLGSTVSGAVHEDGLWTLQFDTYDPELIRYGGPEALPCAEDIFSADSDAVVELLQQGHFRASRARWEAGVRGVDSFMSDFGLDAGGKERFLDARLAAFAEDVRRPAFREWLRRNARRERQRLLERMRRAPTPEDRIVSEILSRRSQRVSSAVQRIGELERAGELTAAMHSIQSSLLHMHLNRLFRATRRRDEEILLDLLRSFYRTVRRSGLPRGG
jgi:thiopeptide-type bacteriocin biosynthesis protein